MTDWSALAQQLRVDSIRVSTMAGSGHPSSSMSAADLMAALMAGGYWRFDFANPRALGNDRLIFSKGHCSPLLYSMYLAAGAIDEAEFATYRRFGSRLEGHPTPVLPFVDVATGSLGQGLAVGAGIAYAAKRLTLQYARTWVLLGDSEMAEGSVWEAIEFAAHEGLSALTAIVDVNRLGQRGETQYGWDTGVYAARARAFGWRAIEIDGHDMGEIARALDTALLDDAPTMIVARTLKGKGVSFIEDKDGWHGRAATKDEAEKAIAELGGDNKVRVTLAVPPVQDPFPTPAPSGALPVFASAIATRQAYGEALAAYGSMNPSVVALDAETSNSTFADQFKKAHPDRFIEVFIAEQKLVGVALGLQTQGLVPFCSTFAAFFTRAADFIRVAAISRANLKLVGSHAGVSIGEDGPSQMAIEDLAMMRAITGSTVLYPADGNATAKLVQAMGDARGIHFLRTTREKTALLYAADEAFPIGGSKTLRYSTVDRATVVAAGITLYEALKAADSLAKDGIAIRVIDAYSVKPIDSDALAKAAQETGGRFVTVEDHRPEGGLGDAVAEALLDAGAPIARITRLAVRELPGSGTPEELRAFAKIDAASIEAAVRAILE